MANFSIAISKSFHGHDPSCRAATWIARDKQPIFGRHTVLRVSVLGTAQGLLCLELGTRGDRIIFAICTMSD